jgi:hypothetical protein
MNKISGIMNKTIGTKKKENGITKIKEETIITTG